MAMGTTCWMFLILTLSASLIPGVPGQHPQASEVQALFAWKKSLTDPNNYLQNWNPSAPNACGWYGIICNTQYLVSQVSLNGKQLSGQLVPQLGQLSALEVFYVVANFLTGSIPPELANSQSLWEINLSKNKFSGKIPATFNNRPNLHIADFSSNGDLCYDFQPSPKYTGDYPVCKK